MISELAVLFFKNLKNFTEYLLCCIHAHKCIMLMNTFYPHDSPVEERRKLRCREVKCFASYQTVIDRVKIQTRKHWIKSLYSLLLYSSCFHAAMQGIEG